MKIPPIFAARAFLASRYSATRGLEALEDGVLVDVTKTAKEAGFRIPVAITRATWAEDVAVPEGIFGQDTAGDAGEPVITIMRPEED